MDDSIIGLSALGGMQMGWLRRRQTPGAVGACRAPAERYGIIGEFTRALLLSSLTGGSQLSAPGFRPGALADSRKLKAESSRELVVNSGEFRG